MPQNRNSEPAPEVMTWTKALPVLIVAIIFDAGRLFFEMFWFFGPALAGLFCTAAVNNAVGTTIAATAGQLVAGTCATAATAGGVLGVEVLAPLGVVMAMAVGLFGWLTIGLVVLMTNSRAIKENQGNLIWFVGSLLVSEVPIIGALPALTGTMAKMYATQIKTEKAAFAAFEKRQAEETLKARQQQAAQLTQARDLAFIQEREEEAANDEVYAEAEAANEETLAQEEIPDELREAA